MLSHAVLANKRFIENHSILMFILRNRIHNIWDIVCKNYTHSPWIGSCDKAFFKTNANYAANSLQKSQAVITIPALLNLISMSDLNAEKGGSLLQTQE